MAEAAIALPVVLLAAFFMVNASLAAYTAGVAMNAASYGARIGAVTRHDAGSEAAGAASAMLSNTQAGSASFEVGAVAQDTPGGYTVVSVKWTLPNWYSSLAAFFGGSAPDFSNTAVAAFKKEGW